MKAAARDKLGLRLTYVANHLASRQYLVGEHFTVADAYLYTVLTWTRIAGIDLVGLARPRGLPGARPAAAGGAGGAAGRGVEGLDTPTTRLIAGTSVV